MVTIEACEHFAGKASFILCKPILRKIRDEPMVKLLQSLLLKQIALADQIAAMLRDGATEADVQDNMDVLEETACYSLNVCNEIAQFFGGKD